MLGHVFLKFCFLNMRKESWTIFIPLGDACKISSYNNDIQYHLKMTQSWQYKKIHRDAKCIIIIFFFIFHPHRFSFYSRNVSIVLRFSWKGKIIFNDILSKSKCLPGTVKFCCRWDEKCVVPDNLRLSWQWKIRQTE